MYALVVDGIVNGVSARTRTTAQGTWLPLVEDPTTFSPYGEQQPSGLTVQKKRVIRHWKAVPRTLTTDDLVLMQEQTAALAQAVQDIAPQELKEEIAGSLQAARLIEEPVEEVGGKERK